MTPNGDYDDDNDGDENKMLLTMMVMTMMIIMGDKKIVHLFVGGQRSVNHDDDDIYDNNCDTLE